MVTIQNNIPLFEAILDGFPSQMCGSSQHIIYGQMNGFATYGIIQNDIVNIGDALTEKANIVSISMEVIKCHRIVWIGHRLDRNKCAR